MEKIHLALPMRGSRRDGEGVSGARWNPLAIVSHALFEFALSLFFTRCVVIVHLSSSCTAHHTYNDCSFNENICFYFFSLSLSTDATYLLCRVSFSFFFFWCGVVYVCTHTSIDLPQSVAALPCHTHWVCVSVEMLLLLLLRRWNEICVWVWVDANFFFFSAPPTINSLDIE